MEGFKAWLAQLNYAWLLDTGVALLASLLCIMVHEVCHGLAAWFLGDPTAKSRGRLSFNPLHHVDIFGLLMMALFGFGWAKAVPVDPRRFKNPKWGMALTALAGPVSNFLLAALALLLYWVLVFFAPFTWAVYGSMFLLRVAVLSLGLGLFNLFPIPPLDGSKVLFAILPDRLYGKLLQYERYGMFLLMALLFSGVLDGPLNAMVEWCLTLLYTVTGLPFFLF